MFQMQNFHALKNMAYGLLTLKSSDLSQRSFRRYSVSNLQFFCRNLLLLRLITATRKYIL